jgi:hypothetical protein
LYSECLIQYREVGATPAIADRLCSVAALAVAPAQPARALRLAGAAAAINEALGESSRPVPVWDRYTEAAHRAPGQDSAAAARLEGRTMSLEQAIATALAKADPP